MAIHRGIQSAIFYYLSCAPCAEVRYRKKRKKDAIRTREERAALEAEMPDVYRQASPSSTNPHWQTEIAAGPALVARGKRKTNATSNNTAPDSRKGLKSSMTLRSNASNTPSSTDVSLRGGEGSSRDGRLDSRWQFQRYQRDDEPYGSLSLERLASSSTLDGSASARSGITRPPKAQIRAGEGRNPQINDLHPATVTNITSKDEMKWLMAPPPTADFMSGKDRSSRSRSDSGGSRLSSRSGIPLSREVSRRIIEQKQRNGEVPLTPPLSSQSTIQIPSDSSGQRHDRSATDERDFAVEDSPKRIPPIEVSEDSTSSTQTVICSQEPILEPIRARRVASRPQLSTIASDSLVPADAESLESDRRLRSSKENINDSDNSKDARDRTERRSALLVKDDSLKILQDLAPASPIFKTKVFSTQSLARDQNPNQVRLPSQDPSEEKKLDGGPEMFDSWYTSDFQLPEWIHEHTKREVTHRWSMDI